MFNNTANKPPNDSPRNEVLVDQKDEFLATTEDEINCLPLASETLYLEFLSRVQIIPTLTSSYQTMIIKGLKCKSLGSPMRQMLQHLSSTLIDLKLFDCEFNMMALYAMLSVLPILESIELNIKLTMKTSIELTKKDLTNLLNFNEIEMEIIDDMANDILDTKSNGYFNSSF